MIKVVFSGRRSALKAGAIVPKWASGSRSHALASTINKELGFQRYKYDCAKFYSQRCLENCTVPLIAGQVSVFLGPVWQEKETHLAMGLITQHMMSRI